MRSRFQVQPDLDTVPIESIVIPAKGRDQLAPILRSLQWLYSTPEVSEAVFELLEREVRPGTSKSTGRPGLDLWQILVLGVVRHARACDFDELEDLASHHALIRQFLNLPVAPGGDLAGTPELTHKTIGNNVRHITAELLQQVNAIVARHGRAILSKKKDLAQDIVAKCDTYVVETNVHFPTDVTLLWDAARKTIDIASSLAGKFGLGGWRKHKSLRKELKGRMRNLGRIASRGGADKPQRLANEAEAYLEKARALSGKAAGTVADLQAVISDLPDTFRLEELLYYSGMLDKHIDLVGRRLVNGEKIPHEEKVFSLFEPHTLWISKGKAGCPVELGRKLLVTTDQHHLVLDYAVLDTTDDHPAAPETIARIMERYGDTPIKSISFDKGFSSKSNRERLMEVGARVIMPAKGKPTAEQRAEEAEKKYVRLRHAHSAVESNINSLEHHGLDRCRDKGIDGYLRCVGLGVLAYNLHQIGKGLMRRDRDAAQAAARRRGAPECRAAA